MLCNLYYYPFWNILSPHKTSEPFEQLLPGPPPMGKSMVVLAKFNTLKYCRGITLVTKLAGAGQERIYVLSTHPLLPSM